MKAKKSQKHSEFKPYFARDRPRHSSEIAILGVKNRLKWGESWPLNLNFDFDGASCQKCQNCHFGTFCKISRL